MADGVPDGRWLRVVAGQQAIALLDGARELSQWPVSTGRAGLGQENGSGCTPRGWHVIRACIGAKKPAGTVFVGRRPTGEIHSAALSTRYPGRDWILSRILWLSGSELGFNRLGERDTMRRYIYIHGGPDDAPVGQAGSAGCVRMRNADVIALFERAHAGMPVLIDD